MTSSMSEPLRPSESELGRQLWHCPNAVHCAQLPGLKRSAPYQTLSMLGPVNLPSFWTWTLLVLILPVH